MEQDSSENMLEKLNPEHFSEVGVKKSIQTFSKCASVIERAAITAGPLLTTISSALLNESKTIEKYSLITATIDTTIQNSSPSIKGPDNTNIKLHSIVAHINSLVGEHLTNIHPTGASKDNYEKKIFALKELVEKLKTETRGF